MAKNMIKSMYNIEIDKELEIFRKTKVEKYSTVISAAVFVL